MYGLPLRTHNSSAKLFPLFTLFDFSQIENAKSFLIGTTNQMVLNNNKIKYDCVVNIDTGKITFNNEIPERVIKTSKQEKLIFNTIHNILKSNFDDKIENWMLNMNTYEPIFEGSDDFIRNEFKSYFFDFLINVSLAIQISNYTSNDTIALSIILENEENKNENSSDEEENDISENMSKKIKKAKKEHDKKIAKSIKKVLSAYNVHFICNWTKSINFKIWVSQYDRNLCLRSSYVKQASNITYIYDNGDVYIGSLARGKKSGFGVLNEFSNNSVYNGSWENDMKSGTGCSTSTDNTCIYDGEWKENKKNGQGQLINNKIKYSGGFKNDFYHGYGILCDSEGNIYEGDFIKGYFDGMGHYKTYTGDVYIGQFKNNLFHGKGQLSNIEGTIYNGSFSLGKKNGEGLLMLKIGDKYEGLFQNDLFEGKGIYTSLAGDIQNGNWNKGTYLVEEVKNDIGELK